ncbi:MAG: AAA family ATPase [Candidatus Azobacteroides sp.]|nr:AAA family ATPase [Candidatus Azobacteroides sp.]
MAIIVDNIELDETNVEFNHASEFVKHTNKLVYLTGKAGTGKTTFLKYLREVTTKNVVILAPTGVAAINAGGQTIHSFFQIKPSIYIPNDKRLRKKADENDTDKSTIYDHFKYFKEKLDIIKGLELLIIDEISMVRCDLLDVIDRLLRVFRNRESEAFGGVQVILIGDTFQLPPIADFKQWSILKPYYKSPFFFSSKVINQNKPIYIELKKIYRQNEQEFIDLLNRIRVNQVGSNELKLLNSKYNPTFSPNGNSNYITLATHNRLVDNTNLTKLTELPTELKQFEANVTGLFPDNIMPTNKILLLKEGAQIMFIKNDKAKRYYNGKIAKISKIENNVIIVKFSDDSEITVERQQWDNIKYKWNDKEKKIEEEIIGTFIQFPIKLAWAITVHKSQGLTFEKVIADLGAAFTSGQVYVALSRCTSFNGLVLKTPIGSNAIKTDSQVLQFAQNETPNTLILQELNSGKADTYYQKVRESVKEMNFLKAYDNFIMAVKFRNDIETDLFKKYFIVTSNKLASFRHKYVTTLDEFNAKNQECEELKVAVSLHKTESLSLQTKINEQNNSIKLLLDSTKKREEECEKLKLEISTLVTQKKFIEKKIYVNETTIQGLQETVERLERTIKNSEQEIKRLKNLKWYQKLFGHQ